MFEKLVCFVKSAHWSFKINNSRTWLEMKRFASVAVKDVRFLAGRSLHFRRACVYAHKYSDVKVGAQCDQRLDVSLIPARVRVDAR